MPRPGVRCRFAGLSFHAVVHRPGPFRYHDGLEVGAIVMHPSSQPVHDQPQGSASAAVAGFPVGYRAIKELANGGQGCVWQAIRLQDNRKVAIKIIRHDRVNNPRSEARFDQEIRTLALLEHPNIVRVLDHGTTDGGERWHVTDYIPGVPLDQYVNEIDKLRIKEPTGRQLRPFPLGEVLDVFLQVLDAVEASHRVGVIHRDLKPSNIIVNREGKAHVLDFGIARAPDVQSPDGVTLTQEFLGSPAWCAPEQVEGKPELIDIRTDVYSLGVILYFLLTGTFPYEAGSSLAELFDQIRKAEPIPPRKHASFIEDDLEAVVLKAIAKDRDHRYQSVRELRDDLRRYLAGEPVTAKGERAGYLLRKFLHRYRWPLAVSAAIFTIIVVSGVVMTAQAIRLKRERDRAVQAEHSATDFAEQARQAFRDSQSLATMIVDQISDRLDGIAGTTALRNDLLQAAYDRLAALVERASRDPALQADYARAIVKLGDIALSLGKEDEAGARRQAAFEIRSKLAAEEPTNASRQRELAHSHVLLGDIAARKGDVSATWRQYESARRIHEELVAAEPANVGYLDDLANSYERLGSLSDAQDDMQTARDSFAKRHAIAQRLVELQPNVPIRLDGLRASHVFMASHFSRQGDIALASEHENQALELAHRLVRMEPFNARYSIHLADAYVLQACGANTRGDVNEAIQLGDRSLAIIERLAATEPSVETYQERLARALLVSAALRLDARDSSPVTLPRLFRAIEILETFTATRPSDPEFRFNLMDAHINAAIASQRLGLADDARRHAEKIAESVAWAETNPQANSHFLNACAGSFLFCEVPALWNPSRALVAAELAAERCKRKRRDVVFNLARALAANGRLDDAWTTVAEVEALVPQDENGTRLFRSTELLLRTFIEDCGGSAVNVPGFPVRDADEPEREEPKLPDSESRIP